MDLLDLFYPPVCAACSAVLRDQGPFCGPCGETLESLPAASCARCSEPGRFERLCPRCAQSPPPFERVLTGWIHGGAISRAIHLFKYEDRPDLARPLGRALAAAVGSQLRPTDVVCPLPLHARRVYERCYDQAHLLARELAREAGLVLVPHALRRVRATHRQVGLSEPDREANVAGAFQATMVKAPRVLLVDDVLTTGATARAAAHALRSVGVRTVWIVTLARAFTSA